MKEFDCVENCPDLGFCCREFALMINGRAIGAKKKMASISNLNKMIQKNGWPFVAKHYDYEANVWYFTCPKLGSDGLCTIYDLRPDVCKKFVPKSCRNLCCAKNTWADYWESFVNFVTKMF